MRLTISVASPFRLLGRILPSPRAALRFLLLAVAAADAVFVVLLVGGLLGGSARAVAPEPEEPAAVERPPATVDSLRSLGAELAERASELDRRELELRELLRGGEVLRQAGIAPEVPPAAPEDDDAGAGRADPPSAVGGSPSFQRLQKAYENMEPESAASALAELAGRDKDAVVELLLGWQPRTSGAILDALTQRNAPLAADLSYEIWKRSGGTR